jgi:thiamine-phosphate pyrophosphorylase
MARPSLARGLYAITDQQLIPEGELGKRVSEAIDGGAAIIQYRDKSSARATRLEQATVLASLCRASKVVLIINDDVELARSVSAAGVHLGIDDDSVRAARAQLGDDAIIGVSCYNQLARARDAVAAGADYVAFGRFFASNTKPNAVTADIELLVDARHQLQVPIVAIGGITPDNGGALIAAGADYLAAIDGVFGQADVYAAALGYAGLFTTKGR